MKAEVKPRIELENRTKLEEVFPLDTPFLIFLDPSDLCNFQCKFCPSGDKALLKKVKRRPGLMDFELYRKIIDDLCTFEKPIKVLRLYKDGEPLLNPRFPEMVRYARERGCALQVDTTTNASLLNPQLNLELIDAGLDRIHISLNGLSDESYRQFTGRKVNFNKLVENIAHFYEHRKNCLVCIKIVGDNLTQEEKDRFFDIFGNIADRIFIEHIAPCWPTFEMKEAIPNPTVGIYGQEIREVMVCPYIFYSLSINSDGKVSLCFLDWSRKLIIGDLNTQSLKSIWNGKTLLNYRKMHLLKKRKDHPLCGICGQLSHGLPDNIDPFAEILIKRIEG
ncbi:MAG TPA: radical SAM/SPASM domain-containing protein [Smithellaceae bacterium]|jgi:MoaA/NifB/PqqE/SkfB family radical SAM enzyme|nr:radical SAM/SPASM domain-containing protein [Smithellaceae bacterium]